MSHSKLIMEQAINVASRSAHKRYMMGAVIVTPDEKTIIAKGWQHTGTWRMRELYSMHAELHCLFKLRHLRGKLEGHKIYIAGIARKSGNFVGAVPCIRCAVSLHCAGISDVVYTVPSLRSTDRYGCYEMDLNQTFEDLVKKYPAPYGE